MWGARPVWSRGSVIHGSSSSCSLSHLSWCSWSSTCVPLCGSFTISPLFVLSGDQAVLLASSGCRWGSRRVLGPSGSSFQTLVVGCLPLWCWLALVLWSYVHQPLCVCIFLFSFSPRCSSSVRALVCLPLIWLPCSQEYNLDISSGFMTKPVSLWQFLQPQLLLYFFFVWLFCESLHTSGLLRLCCRALAVLILFLLAQRSRYWSSSARVTAVSWTLLQVWDCDTRYSKLSGTGRCAFVKHLCNLCMAPVSDHTAALTSAKLQQVKLAAHTVTHLIRSGSLI